MTADRLDRFVAAQSKVYDDAIGELRAGRKHGHWMWFIFPQVAGLGRSEMSRRYAIADIGEAVAYHRHALLGPRLENAFTAIVPHAARGAEHIFGAVDAVKLRSSATLFAEAGSPGAEETLDRFFSGNADAMTLARIARHWTDD